VTCAHPLPPQPGDLAGWDTELRRIRETVATTAGPQIVLGDFNATWDHRLLRDIVAAGDLRDAANIAGAGLRPTWPMRDGPIPMPFVAIDRILTDLAVVDADLVDVAGSDHRMVVATVGSARVGAEHARGRRRDLDHPEPLEDRPGGGQRVHPADGVAGVDGPLRPHGGHRPVQPAAAVVRMDLAAPQPGEVGALHQPQDAVRGLIDPAGHPFCLFTEAG